MRLETRHERLETRKKKNREKRLETRDEGQSLSNLNTLDSSVQLGKDFGFKNSN